VHFGVEGDLIDCGSSIILINRFFQVGNIPNVDFLIFSSSDNEFSIG